jgi:hypothetical protein
MPGCFAVRHDVRGRYESRHMQIMAAGMHHRNVSTTVIFGVHFARVCKSGFFFHRKRVEFRAQHHGRARAVFQNGDNSGAANPFRDVIAQAAQASGEFSGGLGFVRRELGRLMKINVKIVGGRVDGVHFLGG